MKSDEMTSRIDEMNEMSKRANNTNASTTLKNWYIEVLIYEMNNVNDVDSKRSNLNLMLSIVVIILMIQNTNAKIKVERKDELIKLSKLFLNTALR